MFVHCFESYVDGMLERRQKFKLENSLMVTKGRGSFGDYLVYNILLHFSNYYCIESSR